MIVHTNLLRRDVAAAYRRASFEALDNPSAPITTLEQQTRTLRREYRNELRSIDNVESLVRHLYR